MGTERALTTGLMDPIAKCAITLALVLCCGLTGASGNPAKITAAPFSGMEPGDVPPVWRETGFRQRDRTRYRLVEKDGDVVLAASSTAAVAGLATELKVDPMEFPFLTWRWKVGNLLQNSDLTKREGDDFPARVYVIFDYDRRRLPLGTRMKMSMARLLYGAEIPAAALCYVWDSTAPEETFAPNAYTDRIQMIVVRSGPDQVNQWVTETRNVLADYQKAFGEPPPMISGIAVATDTDDTGESAEAWYGDIGLLAADQTESR